MKNQYEIRGKDTAIFLKFKDGTRMETLINTSDLPKASEFTGTWRACWDKNGNTYYVKGRVINKRNRETTVNLHRWILEPPKHLVVDHINHDTLDNRRENLRILTHAENCQNKQLPITNKTGVLGVSFQKSVKKYRVQFMVNGKKLYFGIYESLEEAKKVAIENRKRLMKYSKENQKDIV